MKVRNRNLRTIRLVLAAFLCAAATVFAAPSAPLELKGVRPGMTIDQLNELLPALHCKAESVGKSQCDWLPIAVGTVYEDVAELRSVAGEPVRSWLFQFVDAKLASVTVLFDTQSYATVAGALRAKLGPPSAAAKREAQTLIGVRYLSRDFAWQRGSTVLSAEQYAGDIETAAIVLTTTAYDKRSQQITKQRSTARAKDL